MIHVSRRLLISAPRDSVRRYLRDLQNMAQYEPRVEGVQATYPDESSGRVELSGRFLGLPWRGSFQIQFRDDGGYVSEMVKGPLKRMTASFTLRPVSGGTLLTHEEQHHFPLPLGLFKPLLKKWIGSSIERELGVIKEGAERLHRQLQLKQIEAAL